MRITSALFKTEEVQAVLEGRKTQMRRVLKPTHGGNLEIHDDPGGRPVLCERCKSRCRGLKPPCEPGDILWVQEIWSTTDECGLFPPYPSTGTHYMYKADAPESKEAKEAKWFSPIRMPKSAA